jgi:hypothetical protein
MEQSRKGQAFDCPALTAATRQGDSRDEVGAPWGRAAAIESIGAAKACSWVQQNDPPVAAIANATQSRISASGCRACRERARQGTRLRCNFHTKLGIPTKRRAEINVIRPKYAPRQRRPPSRRPPFKTYFCVRVSNRRRRPDAIANHAEYVLDGPGSSRNRSGSKRSHHKSRRGLQRQRTPFCDDHGRGDDGRHPSTIHH